MNLKILRNIIMSYINITEKVNNSVHTIFLNRPDRLNAWTEEMATEIKQSMDNASKNDEVKVVIANFCFCLSNIFFNCL